MIIRVPDRSGNPEYDLFLTVDTDLCGHADALSVVKKAVTDTQTAAPEHYTFDDLQERLPNGITAAHIVTADVEW